MSLTAAAVEAFIARAQRVPEVRQILTVASEEGLAIWTVLDRVPDSGARQAVYRLEALTQQEYPGALLDFRVINLAEFPEDQRDLLLPSGAVGRYTRPADAPTTTRLGGTLAPTVPPPAASPVHA